MVVMVIAATAGGIAALAPTMAAIWRLDGPSGCGPDPRDLLVFVIQTPTRYAPDYSHGAFARIRPGMAPEQVHDLVGDPLSVNGGTHDYSENTGAKPGMRHRVRTVHYSHGVVSGVAFSNTRECFAGAIK